MKTKFDKCSRCFKPGDKVLVVLTVLGHLQARYFGPYTTSEKEWYLIKTPDRRNSQQLCHINMLKPYFERKKDIGPEELNNMYKPVNLCFIL